MTDRACTATTKAGNPCRGKPITGKHTCLAHSGDVRGTVGFGGPQPGSGRPRKPHAVELLREKIEADLDRWLKPLDDALQAERAVVVGNGPSAYLELVPDYAVRLRAVADALDRAYGRPAQSHEVKHSADGSQLDAEIDALLKEMARRETAPSMNGTDARNGSG